ncbi:MAG: type II toxin-antitoxin system RelB/DinJ family antitoxin [Oscillospiraceae bacterium]
MAQVMVNFRMDEDIKKNMEQACREMGLSMTTAFTIFATKVGKEKRIPFEVTAEPRTPAAHQGQSCRRADAPVPVPQQEQLEALCADIRQSLTAVHTAIPSSITGLCVERIRLLCGNELKDKAAQVSKGVKALSSGGAATDRDPRILDEYLDGLSSVAEELRELGRTLIPTMKSWSGGDTGVFDPYEQRLAAISKKFDGLAPVLVRFLHSTSGGSQAVQARLRQAAAAVETPYVLTALENLEALILRHYGALDARTKARLESDYLQTLELTLKELGQAERDGADIGGKAALCLRAANVLSQVVSGAGQAGQEWSRRSLEAEVEALERLAAMRGDTAGGIKPEN